MSIAHGKLTLKSSEGLLLVEVAQSVGFFVIVYSGIASHCCARRALIPATSRLGWSRFFDSRHPAPWAGRRGVFDRFHS
jgi:hypothetical protein